MTADLTADQLQRQLRALGNPQDAAFLARFFKTGPGQYGEGDTFIGVRVPAIRKAAARFAGLALSEIERLLESAIHEERLAALVIMVKQASRADATLRRQLYDFYLAHTRRINNWDLVDLSAPHLVGGHLFDKSRQPLYALAKSDWLWDRRIAVLATFYFIRRGDFADTLSLARRLKNDRQDLMHKAVGWMLREVGKRDEPALRGYLDAEYQDMPRTMLRYAIERLPQDKRLHYLGKTPGR